MTRSRVVAMASAGVVVLVLVATTVWRRIEPLAQAVDVRPDRVGNESGAAAGAAARPSTGNVGGDSAELVVSDSVLGCKTCSIELTQRGSVGARTDQTLLRDIPRAVVDRRGVIYAVVVTTAGHEILRYEPGGRQGTVVGGLGSGPGEYRAVSAITVMSGDSLLVAHDGVRLTVFAPSGRVARSARVPLSGVHSIVQGTSPVAVFVAARGTSAGSAGLPVHRVSAAGEIEHSFGSVGRVPPYVAASERHLALDDEGALWVAERRTFRLERVARDGRVLQTLGVLAPEFGPPVMTAVRADFNYRKMMADLRSGNARDRTAALLRKPDHLLFAPPSMIDGIAVESSGLLWVVSHVAAPNWRDLRVTYDERFPDEVIQSSTLLPKKYSTLIHVIDPHDRAVLARKLLPGYWRMAGKGSVIRWAFDREGIMVGDVFTVLLRR